MQTRYSFYYMPPRRTAVPPAHVVGEIITMFLCTAVVIWLAIGAPGVLP